MENKEEKKQKDNIVKLDKNSEVTNAKSLENKGEAPKSFNKKQELWRALKFVLFSISAGAIQMISSLLLRLVILDYVIPANSTVFFIIEQSTIIFIADTVGLALSIIWNFTFNRKFTFKSANNVPIAMLLAFVFYIPFYPFQIWYIPTIENALIGSLGQTFAYIIALVTCMIINFVLEFLWQNFVVFRKSIDSNVKRKERLLLKTNLKLKPARVVKLKIKGE